LRGRNNLKKEKRRPRLYGGGNKEKNKREKKISKKAG
jgi:hypothetical protein